MATTSSRTLVMSDSRGTGLTVADILDFATALGDARIPVDTVVERVSNERGDTVQLIAVNDAATTQREIAR